jgi:hypothetical protein
MQRLRLVLAHLPILLSVALSVVVSPELGLLRSESGEASHAGTGLALVTLAALLALVQLAIWLVWARRRFA